MSLIVLFLLVTLQTATLSWGNGLHPLTQEVAVEVVDRVAREVERLRSLAFETRVPVKVIGDEQAREHFLNRVKKFGDSEQIRVTSESYQLLGLLPPDTDILETILDVLEDQAGGFYDPDARTYYLLDDAPSALAAMLTAHELTHALEDQHFDLDRRLLEVVDDDDRLFARSAVHEGSATLLMTLFLAHEMLSGNAEMLDMEALSQMGFEGGTEGIPPVLMRQLAGPYVLGAGFLAGGNLLTSVGRGFPVDRVNRAYREGPLSSEQILHPEKFWDPEQRDDPRAVHLSGAGKMLGRRFKLRGQGVLGELTLGVLTGSTSPMGPESLLGGKIGEAWTDEAAKGWGGDRWELWGRGRRRVALHLSVWDTPEDAREFAEALEPREGSHSKLFADRVAIVSGDIGIDPETLLDRMLGAAAEREPN